ncbi:MAG: amidase, partial [Actinomycetota bacterium]|nr:amidase [Actinomycetota bacterium]
MTRAPATSPSELCRLTASEAARLIERRALGSEELVGACLERIAAREPEIGAWTHLDPEAALARARELDAQASRGVLHGLPVGVKDVIDTAAMPTAYGSLIYDGHRPARDAACVVALQAAGAVVLGKTVSTELATWTPAGTVNPLDPRRTPGGSSSGSAAAVAASMVPLALGSQTGGSIIRPGSYCGVFALKPTFG